ncbi:synaptonemal complex protein 3-like [Lineus longissimus]|uniref:synaptonemal complex protein 3-like n=1 Tax=Lineus longissimus TaxID=88925 RepID=UPI00315D1FE1
MDGNNSLQAIPAVIKSFGAEFQKKYSSRKEKLDQFSKNTLKSAHKQVDKFWNHQQTSRQRMLDSFTEGILLELTELEKDIDNLKHAENKSVEFLKSHLNTLQTCRLSQEQRIKNLKRKHLNFDGEQRQLENNQADQQQNVREILRKELQTMQKKILMQSQKEEMMNVRRTLQMMFQ